jgi:diguanylate cyclase (GGDEF)-like protein
MNAPKISIDSQPLAASAFLAYAQLVKMLLPSSGCFAIHDVHGDLAWCSDGFERPDFRELIEEVRRSESGALANQGLLRKTSAGASAVVARLCGVDGTALGFVLLELRGAATAAASSMAISLTRPLFACLASQLSLEGRANRPATTDSAPPPVAAPSAPMGDSRLDFLLGAGEFDLASPGAIQELLRRCVERLDCLCAALCIPDRELTEVAERAEPTDAATRAHLDATRRHLLAWAQLNNRPMVVNRIDESKSPYKILSAPVPSREGKSGLLALFRSADSPNFELDDVRLIEFMGRLAMALLNERRDRLTGLMCRPGFERYLESARTADKAGFPGTLVYFDIVALREINASFGLKAGDEAIVRAAQLIRRSLAPQEIACRLSGDSFIVHLPGRDAAAAAAFGAEIAQAAVDLGYVTDGSSVSLALRWSATVPDAAASDVRHWIAAAELACRNSGTNLQKPSL